MEAYLTQVWGDVATRFRLMAENTAAEQRHRRPDRTIGAHVIEPLRLSYEIRCPPDHAFEVWTTRLSSWWPKGHSASGHPDTTVVFEPRLGGRIFERTPDGTEIDWGEITELESTPPSRLSLAHRPRPSRRHHRRSSISWPWDDGTTRLDIVHDGWERLGADGPVFREANTSGWNALIPSFVMAAEG